MYASSMTIHGGTTEQHDVI